MKTFTLILLILTASCATQRKSSELKLEEEMRQYVGMRKETLIQNLGFPTRIEELEGNPVLIYSGLKTSGIGVFARQYYQHRLFFFEGGRVNTWLIQNNELPVEQLNIRLIQPPRVY